MPPAVPELRNTERLGKVVAPPVAVSAHSVLSLNPPAQAQIDSVGATIGIAANPLYSSSPNISQMSPVIGRVKIDFKDSREPYIISEVSILMHSSKFCDLLKNCHYSKF